MDLLFDLGEIKWFKIFTVLHEPIKYPDDANVKAQIRHFITSYYGPFGDIDGNWCNFEPTYSPKDKIVNLFGVDVNYLAVGSTYVYIPAEQNREG